MLSPFAGGVACLSIISTSGLAQPPLVQHKVEDSLVALATAPLLSFAQSAIKKALTVSFLHILVLTHTIFMHRMVY